MRRLALAGLMLAIALPLAAQRTKAAPKTTDSAQTSRVETGPWMGSTKGKTYYRTGCAGASKLAAKNRIYFKSEEDAKKAGYSHSRQKGC